MRTGHVHTHLRMRISPRYYLDSSDFETQMVHALVGLRMRMSIQGKRGSHKPDFFFHDSSGI